MGSDGQLSRTADCDLGAVSIHEAGHAVIAAIHGLRVGCASIYPDGHSCPISGRALSGEVVDASGYTPLGALRVFDDPAMALRCAQREIRVLMAGPLAEALATGTPIKELIANGSYFDWESALEVARDFHADEDAQAGMLREASREAFNMLRHPPVWAAVQELADVLHRWGRADGAKAREIVARHIRHGQAIPM